MNWEKTDGLNIILFMAKKNLKQVLLLRLLASNHSLVASNKKPAAFYVVLFSSK